MKTKFFIVLLFIVNCPLLSQWSTSTKAESALYVCPGFNQGILTFDDGSSIICGALSDSRYVQKLDPYGYKMWQQPVQVYNTPGTNNTGNALSMVTDGDGGVILWWADFRGAEVGQFGAYNNSMYMQKVDKNGQIKWQSGGVQIVPLAGGGKGAWGVADGQGGIILHMDERDFLRPQAAKRAVTWVVRYNANGQEMWRHDLDTSTVEFQLTASQPVKLGSRVMISTLKGLKFFHSIAGDTLSIPSFVPKGSFVTYKDSVAYNLENKQNLMDSTGNTIFVYGVTQVSLNWDSVWYSEYKITDEADEGGYAFIANSLVPNKYHGLFNVWAYRSKTGIVQSRIQWVTQTGYQWGKEGIQIKNKIANSTFNGKDKFGIYFSNGTAQIVDSTGDILWDSNYVVISDPLNAYSPIVKSDNNGGAIIAYWTVLGGIYAQHTGRVGTVGIITKVSDNADILQESELYQNYPNPFNPVTTIPFSLRKTENVELTIYDVLGRKIVTLVQERLAQGKYEVKWDANRYSSGIYYYRLQINNSALVKKIILLH